MKPKAIIVLEALYEGLEVDIDRYRLVMENGAIYHKGMKINLHTNAKSEVLLGTDLELNGFLLICELLSEKELFAIAGNITLNRIKHHRPAYLLG